MIAEAELWGSLAGTVFARIASFDEMALHYEGGASAEDLLSSIRSKPPGFEPAIPVEVTADNLFGPVTPELEAAFARERLNYMRSAVAVKDSLANWGYTPPRHFARLCAEHAVTAALAGNADLARSFAVDGNAHSRELFGSALRRELDMLTAGKPGKPQAAITQARRLLAQFLPDVGAPTDDSAEARDDYMLRLAEMYEIGGDKREHVPKRISEDHPDLQLSEATIKRRLKQIRKARRLKPEN